MTWKRDIFWQLNCVHLLNWMTWNRDILTIKLCTLTKLNDLK